MKLIEIERLRSYTDKLVRLEAHDGEVMVVKVHTMQDEYQDFIYDIVSTNRESKYTQPLTLSAYVMRYDDVLSFDLNE